MKARLQIDEATYDQLLGAWAQTVTGKIDALEQVVATEPDATALAEVAATMGELRESAAVLGAAAVVEAIERLQQQVPAPERAARCHVLRRHLQRLLAVLPVGAAAADASAPAGT